MSKKIRVVRNAESGCDEECPSGISRLAARTSPQIPAGEAGGELEWYRVAKICKNDLKNINSKEMPTPAPRSQSGKQGMQRGESSGVDLQKH